MTWYATETPFGPILFTVWGDGTTLVWQVGDTLVHRDAINPAMPEGDYPEPDATKHGHGGALPDFLVNGKSYLTTSVFGGHSYNSSITMELYRTYDGREGVRIESYLQPFTQSARDKVCTWFHENWHTLVTPVRVHLAKWHDAESMAYYALEEFKKAETKRWETEHAVNIALAELQTARAIEFNNADH